MCHIGVGPAIPQVSLDFVVLCDEVEDICRDDDLAVRAAAVLRSLGALLLLHERTSREAVAEGQALRALSTRCGDSPGASASRAATISRSPRWWVRSVHAHCSMTLMRKPGCARNATCTNIQASHAGVPFR